MKARLGIIMIILCVISFFLYNKGGSKSGSTANVEQLIQGQIVDATTERPLEGVSVAKQGTNPSALSNSEGRYAILAFTNKELVFRRDGYKTQVVPAKDAKLVKLEVADSAFINKVKADFPNAEIEVQ